MNEVEDLKTKTELSEIVVEPVYARERSFDVRLEIRSKDTVVSVTLTQERAKLLMRGIANLL